MIALPLVGMAVDKGFSRFVALAGIAGSGLLFASFGMSNGNLFLWCFQWLLFALFLSGVNPLVWSAAVSSNFHAARGLALAIVLSGSSIGSSTAPLVARRLIDDFGWRGGFIGLALIYGVIAFVLVALFFERKPRQRVAVRAGDAAQLLPGLTFKEAMVNSRMLMIMGATFLAFMLLVSMLMHAAPMMESRGASPAAAAMGAATVAAFMLVGKLVLGWALDLAPGHLIGAITYALPGAACLYLREFDAHGTTAYFALAVMGFGFGGIMQLTAYLVGRYVGLRAFGKVFGVVSSLMALAGGLGPVVAGAVFDATRNYDLFLLLGAPVAVGSALLILFLGRYPSFETPAQPELAPAAAS
jgi:MFS family permease